MKLANAYAIMNEYDIHATEFLNQHGASIEFEFIGKKAPKWGSMAVNAYIFTIERGGEHYSNVFYDSINNTNKGIEPTAYSLLSCVQKDNPGTFVEFCSEYGYDVFDRRSEDVYDEVRKEYYNIERLFHDCMEELREIW